MPTYSIGSVTFFVTLQGRALFFGYPTVGSTEVLK